MEKNESQNLIVFFGTPCRTTQPVQSDEQHSVVQLHSEGMVDSREHLLDENVLDEEEEEVFGVGGVSTSTSRTHWL